MQGGGFAVPMVNDTITMEVALRATDIGWGDEVIVPAYTFSATAVAPMAAGAIPVLVDVDPNTYCINPKAIEAAITPKTRLPKYSPAARGVFWMSFPETERACEHEAAWLKV